MLYKYCVNNKFRTFWSVFKKVKNLVRKGFGVYFQARKQFFLAKWLVFPTKQTWRCPKVKFGFCLFIVIPYFMQRIGNFDRMFPLWVHSTSAIVLKLHNWFETWKKGGCTNRLFCKVMELPWYREECLCLYSNLKFLQVVQECKSEKV